MQEHILTQVPTFTNLLTKDLEDGQAAFADILKTLVYKTDSILLEWLDFDNDFAFTEPLLFAYFNTPSPSINLRQILFGYIEDEKKPNSIEVLTDENGIIFLPQVGYLKTNLSNTKLNLCWDNATKKLSLKLKDKTISYIKEDILKLKSVGIEVWKYPHPLAKEYLRKWDFDKQVEKEIQGEVEIKNTLEKHLEHLDNSFKILKKCSPTQFEHYKKFIRRLAIYTNYDVRSFAVRSVHGVTFLTMDVLNEDDEIFFLEEVSHQSAHNVLNAIMYEMSDYFKIDADHELLADYINNPKELRSISSAFHGLYTVAARLEVFLKAKADGLFEGKQEYEFLGRFAHLKNRHLTGLEKIEDLNAVYTEKGLKLYEMLNNYCLEGFKEIEELNKKFDFSNQPNTFSYPAFIKLNPLK